MRPPGELPPTQGLDAFNGLPSAQWGGLLGGGGGSTYSSPGAGPSNRHSWAGSINSPAEQNSGFFEWGVNDVSSNGMEDVRVCSDCYAGSSPQNDNRGTPGSGVSIHRTWNGSSSPTIQGRLPVSELWGNPGINTPEANIGRRRRQSVSGK